MNYQKAYQLIAERARACLQMSMAGNDRRTEEKLDTEAQFGEVRYINHNLFWGDDYFGYYIVKPVAASRCEITAYHPSNALGHYDDEDTVKGWLSGSKHCPL